MGAEIERLLQVNDAVRGVSKHRLEEIKRLQEEIVCLEEQLQEAQAFGGAELEPASDENGADEDGSDESVASGMPTGSRPRAAALGTPEQGDASRTEG